GEFGDRRHLAQQSQAVETSLVDRARRPGQLRGPPDLALDFLDELPDLGGRRFRLLALDTNQGGLVLLVGKPDFRRAVGDQRQAHDGEDQRDVFTKQAPPRLGRFRPQRDRWSHVARALVHSITSSARPRSESGTSRPSALAVLRLMISSTLVDCCTGRSAGFSPLRMRPVYSPTCRKASVRLAL